MCFLALVEVQKVFSNAVTRRSSNVSRSVVGFRHLTRNTSAICIMLSVSRGELKLSNNKKISWHLNDFQGCILGSYFAGCITHCQCMNCWKTLIRSFPNALKMSCRRNIDLLTPELQTSHSSLRPRSLQFTVK